ncbi:MAG: hypothetical protein ACTH4Y_12090 [Microbacterium gubbeenense]|uniref:hypothetical protein n=1 Tax=Microbacterium gubbeenense TaxID=159896 RepID=UPI003F99427D
MQFDARPLSEPVDRQTARVFASTLRERFPFARRGTLSIAGIVIPVVMFIFSLPLLAIGIGALILNPPPMGLIFTLMSVAMIAGGVLILVKRGDSAADQYRLDRFAAANGMRFHPGYDDPQLPGVLFTVGRDRQSSQLVRGEEPRFVEFGNFRYTTGSGKSEQTHRWGYIAVRLDAPLPNIVLDAEGNNGLFGSNLPVRLDKRQRLSLEGNFDQYFSLYCPQGYETDALYLFTPDIMQRFMNRAAQLDVEIVDDWLFFYSGAPLSTLDADRWRWEFSVVGAMLDKIARWSRWRDERLRIASTPPVSGVQPALADPQNLRPPEGVAEPGRRLKRRGIAWVTIVVGVVVLLQVVGFVVDAIF